MSDRFELGLDTLDVGSEMFKQYKPDDDHQDIELDYSNRIPIGRRTDDGSLVWLNLQSSDRIGIFGKTGDGKTYLLKTIISRLYKGDYNVIHVSDVKNDMHDIDNKGGISKDLMDLLPAEDRQPIPKRMFMPKLLANQYPEQSPYFVEPFTYSMEELSQSDFISLVNPSTDSQEDLTANIFNNTEPLTFDNLYTTLEEMNTDARTKRSVKQSIERLEDEQILGERYVENPTEHLDEGIISLALENWRQFKRGGLEKIEIYISITLRHIQQKLRDGEFDKGAAIVVDEAHVFLPSSGNSISKEDLIDLVDLGRTYDIPMIFSTQRPSQIPKEAVIEQMSYFFISPNISKAHRKQLLEEANIYRFGDLQKNKWSSLFQEMNKHQWLMVDVENGTYEVIDPLSPLCAHTG